MILRQSLSLSNGTPWMKNELINPILKPLEGGGVAKIIDVVFLKLRTKARLKAFLDTACY